MRTVRSRILLWCFGTLLLSLVAFGMISTFVSGAAARGAFVTDVHAWQAAEAVRSYQSGGPQALADYLKRLHRFVKEQTYLTDARGKDLVSGEDRSPLVRIARPPSQPPRRANGRLVMITSSVDNAYRLISVIDPPLAIRSLLPYYFLVLVAVGLLCWILALNIATPLRDLAHAVDRFGRGELNIRLKSSRKDEIGDLTRSFDQMAERIGTLLTAERRLLQDVSHELRSPLARLSLGVELIRSASDREAAVARLKKEVDRLTDLVRTLVEVTRAEGDPSTTRLEPLQLGDLVLSVVEDCRLDADARGCGIHANIEFHAEVRGDRELLRRAMENIVRNAIRYTPPKSLVDVTMSNVGQSVRLCIRDAGPGVSDESLEKIFQPFFRVDESRDSATGGIGLGLSIAQRAVAVHHGRLWAENVHPGLAVSIELPIAA